MDELRQIIHIDMDAFYASIEQRDNPKLRGKPVAVGGDPKGRGVVMTCSYEARKYGIHSAMPAKKALTLCPQVVFVRPRFYVYIEISNHIKEIFYQYTDLVQPMSLDEAYLDITEISNDFTSAKLIAEEILFEIYKQTKLTASAGISFNKFLAKVGSDYNKPNGLTLITPENADEFIDRLPIGKFFGVGKVTEKKMIELGIHTGANLKNFGLKNLKRHFGKSGEYFYNCAIGIDARTVSSHWSRKSLGMQRTLGKDIDNKEEIISFLEKIALKIEEHLKDKKLKGRTITLKVRYYNFHTLTRSITLKEAVDNGKIIIENIKKLLDKTEVGKKKVRLLGITISNFIRNQYGVKYKQSMLKI